MGNRSLIFKIIRGSTLMYSHMFLKVTVTVFILGVFLSFFFASGSFALWLDLTTVPSNGMINGAVFYSGTAVSGTGLIDSFVRIQASGTALTEWGYNTDGALEGDTKSGSFTHSIQISDIENTLVDIDGTEYYEFLLDINETTGNSLLTVQELEIYLDTVGNNTGYPALGTLVWDLDAGEDSEITIDYNNFPGSGGLDMFAYIPTSVFSGYPSTEYIYLYSKLGNPDTVVDDGFEEWAHSAIDEPIGPPVPPLAVIPEPATIMLFGIGLLGLGTIARRRRKRK